jgi:hypothetical protein
MRPAEALDIHTDLTVRLDDMRMCRWIQAWAARAKLRDPDVGVQISDQIQEASTFHVVADVNERIYELAKSYSDDTRTDIVQPPTEYGLLVFDEPLDPKHVGGYSQYFHMISWGRARVESRRTGEVELGYTITTWCDANRGADTATNMLRVNARTLREGTTDAQIESMTGGFFLSNVLVMLDFQQCGPLVTRLSLDERDNATRNGFDPDQGGKVSLARLLMAAWQHMATPESEPEEGDERAHVQRTARKRAQRAGLSGDVSVIVMRRPSSSRPVLNPGSGRGLDHQVPVRGHWRNQACGAGRKERRRVWIEDHLRGPEGTPVVAKAKVYDVR